MERPTITIEGKTYEMKKLVGGDWRVLGEFRNSEPTALNADFIEKHAKLISNFFGVSPEEILDKMPLEEILPTTRGIQNYMIEKLSAKLEVIEKNSDKGKAE